MASKMFMQKPDNKFSSTVHMGLATKSLEGRFKGVVFILIEMGNSSRVFKEEKRQDPTLHFEKVLLAALRE